MAVEKWTGTSWELYDTSLGITVYIGLNRDN